jgi:hypothetical protein
VGFYLPVSEVEPAGHYDSLSSAGDVLGRPLESVQLPWGLQTKDLLRESRIPGRNAGELLLL